MDFHIREAKCTDTTEIHNCNKLSLPVVYTKRELIQFILNPNSIIMIAIFNNKIIGYAIVRKEVIKNGYKCHIMSIAVLEEHRSKGIGKELVDKSFDWYYHKNNITIMTLYVMKSNYRAIRFYQKNSFTKALKLPHYYGKNNHGLMMKKTRLDDNKREEIKNLENALKNLI